MIGAAVVYGFALYGAAKFFDRPRMEVLIKSDTTGQVEAKPEDAGKEAAASGHGGPVGETNAAAVAESASAKADS